MVFKKTATDLEQSLLAKESDVFLVRGDMVISIKSSDVQVGDVLVVSQGNEILFDRPSGFRIRHGQ